MPMTRITPLTILFFVVISLSSYGGEPLAAGKEHTVEMTFKGEKMVYSPAKLSIRLGDKVTFVMVSGAPHTVTFDKDRMPGRTAAEKAVLADRLSYNENGGYFQEPGESYTIQFADVPKGKYAFYCIPHRGMGMEGVITVK